MNDVTRILNAIEQGDAKAADELLPLIYEELRVLAAQKLSHELPGQTLQPTALVHEAYIRLVGAENQNWDSSGHFFAAAAEAMRRILVDNARRKKSQKYGGNRQRIDLDNANLFIESLSEDLIALDEALTKLAGEDPERASQCTLASVQHIVSGKAAARSAASMFSARNVTVAPVHGKSGAFAQEISQKGTTDP